MLFFPLLRSSICLQKVLFHSSHVISMKHVFLQTPEDCRNADRWFAYMPAEYLVRRVMCGQAAKWTSVSRPGAVHLLWATLKEVFRPFTEAKEATPHCKNTPTGLDSVFYWVKVKKLSAKEKSILSMVMLPYITSLFCNRSNNMVAGQFGAKVFNFHSSGLKNTLKLLITFVLLM